MNAATRRRVRFRLLAIILLAVGIAVGTVVVIRGLAGNQGFDGVALIASSCLILGTMFGWKSEYLE